MQSVSTAQEIRRRFLTLFTVFALVLSLSVIGVVGFKLVRQRQQDSIELINSLKRSIIDDKPDWYHWRQNSTINTRSTYVRVHNTKIGNAPGTYYSADTQKFLKTQSWQIPFLPALSYVRDYGLMYYRSGERLGIHSEIWLSMSPVTSVLKSLTIIVLVILILGWLISWFFISLIARKLTEPLTLITQAASEQAQSANTTKADLPVPNNPTEAHDLATSFNELLTAINAQTEQEKEFISNAAHELRTPIAAILGHAKLVQRRGSEHPEIIPKSLKFITDEASRMQSLVNSLLTLSRADRGTLKLSYFDLTSVVNETVEEARAVQQQSIVTELGPETIVNGNPESIQQVLMALLENAGKYSPTDSQIKVTVGSNSQEIILSVADQGTGIPDTDKQRIFDRFYRIDAARNHAVGGTGLGLAIVAQLASLNQVKVDVTDTQPHGSQFNLHFVTPHPDK